VTIQWMAGPTAKTCSFVPLPFTPLDSSSDSCLR
jgi:hypothetical protein